MKLTEASAAHPVKAEARIGDRAPVVASLVNNSYTFELPSQVADSRLEVRVGDATRSIAVEPMLRPELTSIVAEVTLPDYLGRPGSERKDVRGGTITLVKGSKAVFSATAGRELAAAWVDGVEQAPKGKTATSPSIAIDGPRELQFRWVDRFGLAGKEPFTLKITGRDDEAPSLIVEDLPSPEGRARLGAAQLQGPRLGRLRRPAGRPDLAGARPQGRQVDRHGRAPARRRAAPTRSRWKSPERSRRSRSGSSRSRSRSGSSSRITCPAGPGSFRRPYTLFVLSAEQHAIWLTEQLSKWHRQSLEVRDREMLLHEANKQLRAMAPEELDRPETRRKIEAQSQAERANGRRLSGLVMSGEDLVKQAMRNPEFGVGHLERWAEMLQILKDISGNRMPSVADLLKQAAQAEKALAAVAPSNNAPMAGNVRSGGSAKPSTPAPGEPEAADPGASGR